MHDVVVVGVPLLAILGGMFFNSQALARVEARIDGRVDRLQSEVKQTRDELRGETKDIRGDIRDLRTEMTSLRTEMHREFEQFYRTLGQHDAKIEALERQS
jgi:predicted  nucleic acid-binding Zn-ribbon protein